MDQDLAQGSQELSSSPSAYVLACSKYGSEQEDIFKYGSHSLSGTESSPKLHQGRIQVSKQTKTTLKKTFPRTPFLCDLISI